jgi:hypothetical protein
METKELLARWQVLLNEPVNTMTIRGVLEERLVILHRLNELGEKSVEGLPLVKALEATNASLRGIDHARPAN